MELVEVQQRNPVLKPCYGLKFASTRKVQCEQCMFSLTYETCHRFDSYATFTALHFCGYMPLMQDARSLRAKMKKCAADQL